MSREHYPCPCCGEQTIDVGDHHLPACECKKNQRVIRVAEEIYELVKNGGDVCNVYDVLVTDSTTVFGLRSEK